MTVWDGSWRHDPARFVVCSYGPGDKYLVPRKDWAAINRQARINGTPILIETVQG